MSWKISASATIMMSVLIAGCSKAQMPGKYASEYANEVDMFDLVESPAGHLSGTFIVSAIDQKGERKPDAVQEVSGSIYHGNVSLRIGEPGIFSHQVIATGTLNSREMHLDIDGSTRDFTRMTDQKYQDVLAVLIENGNSIRQRAAALRQRAAALEEAKELGNHTDTLDAELQGFVHWGNDRIARVSNVRDWYAIRVTTYQKCVNFVRPLALRHVPSWKWQSCVLNMDNDSYNRQQTADNIAQLKSKGFAEAQNLNAKVAALPQQISELHDALNKVCSLSASKTDCRVKIEGIMKNVPSPSLTMHIKEFRNMLPQLDSAIDADMHASKAGENKLSALVSEANNVLRGSH